MLCNLEDCNKPYPQSPPGDSKRKEKKSDVYMSATKRIVPLGKITLLHPVPVAGTCGFAWPGLEVRHTVSAGFGLFALDRIPAGTAIPMIGRALSSAGLDVMKGTDTDTHIWTWRSRTGLVTDGSPQYFPFQNVGCAGLAIGSMANEPSRKKPTCKFSGNDCLVVCRHLRPGEELTVLYGESYHRMREMQSYSVAANPYYGREGIEPVFRQLPGACERHFPHKLRILSDRMLEHTVVAPTVYGHDM